MSQGHDSKVEDFEKLTKFSIERVSQEVYWITPEGQFIYTNKTAREKLGYSKKELKEMYVWDVDKHHRKEDRKKRWRKLKEEGDMSFLSKHETKDGEVYPVEITSHHIEFKDKEYEFAFAKDITKRKTLQMKNKRSSEKLETIFESMEVGVIITDLEGNIIEANQAAAEIAGYEDKEEYMKHNAYEFVHPEDRDKAKKASKKAFERGSAQESSEYRTLTKDGKIVHTSTRTSMLTDEKGNPTATVNVVRDITERKEAEEREKLLNTLLQHDIRNKAQIVAGYLQILQDFELPEEPEEYLKKIEKVLRDSMNLIKKVKTLQSIEKEEITEIKIDPIIKAVISERNPQAQEKGMEIEYEEINSKVMGGSLLEELFNNLIENSIEHSQGNKTLIRGEVTKDNVTCIIEDDGKGIPDNKKEKIFNKGYTTDKKRGTGLGTNLVKKIVENYKGNIEVKDSELGGARFDIQLKKA